MTRLPRHLCMFCVHNNTNITHLWCPAWFRFVYIACCVYKRNHIHLFWAHRNLWCWNFMKARPNGRYYQDNKLINKCIALFWFFPRLWSSNEPANEWEWMGADERWRSIYRVYAFLNEFDSRITGGGVTSSSRWFVFIIIRCSFTTVDIFMKKNNEWNQNRPILLARPEIAFYFSCEHFKCAHLLCVS